MLLIVPSAPLASNAFIKTIAVAMIRIASRYPNIPSTRWRTGNPSPATRAPATDESASASPAGNFHQNTLIANIVSITSRIISSAGIA